MTEEELQFAYGCHCDWGWVCLPVIHRITPEDYYILEKILKSEFDFDIKELCSFGGGGVASNYRHLRDKYGISSYDQIQLDWYMERVIWLYKFANKMIDDGIDDGRTEDRRKDAKERGYFQRINEIKELLNKERHLKENANKNQTYTNGRDGDITDNSDVDSVLDLILERTKKLSETTE